MKNEAEIIWWKTVKQDVETTPLGFTEAAARVGGADSMDGESIFKRARLSIIIIYIYLIDILYEFFNIFLFNIYRDVRDLNNVISMLYRTKNPLNLDYKLSS